MKLEIFDLTAISQFADYLLDVAEAEGCEDDFVTEMLASKLTRLEALNVFKESCMVYSIYLKVCLIKEDYTTADKFKRIMQKEFENTIAVIDAIGELGEDDEVILSQILKELNFINTTNI